jgi:hypothetical protein
MSSAKVKRDFVFPIRQVTVLSIQAIAGSGTDTIIQSAQVIVQF